MNDLPQDVCDGLLSFLSMHDSNALVAVSSTWRDAVSNSQQSAYFAAYQRMGLERTATHCSTGEGNGVAPLNDVDFRTPLVNFCRSRYQQLSNTSSGCKSNLIRMPTAPRSWLRDLNAIVKKQNLFSRALSSIGNVISTAFSSVYRSAPKDRYLMLGLDAAGKTTALYKLFQPGVDEIVETMRFTNIEQFETPGGLPNSIFYTWDVGGSARIRPLWKHYYSEGVKGIIFVVDANDPDRLDPAFQELFWIASRPELEKVSILIMVNKQDLATSRPVMSPEDFTQKLFERDYLNPRRQFHDERKRKWCVQGGSIVYKPNSVKGWREGMLWLLEHGSTCSGSN